MASIKIPLKYLSDPFCLFFHHHNSIINALIAITILTCISLSSSYVTLAPHRFASEIPLPRPQDIAPTYAQVIEKILHETGAPMSVLELAQKITAARPSTSKDPVKEAEKKIKEAVGRQLVYLDSHTILPLKMAWQGVRFRMEASREEASKGFFDVGNVFASYLPNGFDLSNLRLVDVNGQAIKFKINTVKKKIKETGSAAGKKDASPRTESAPRDVVKKSERKEVAKVKPIQRKIVAPPKPLADHVEVYTDPTDGTITAYMMRRQSELAVRWWTMTDERILVSFRCEKMWECEANGMVFRPSDDIERQMNLLLTRFREEYNLPDKKTRYFHIRVGKPFEEKKLKIPSGWRDEALLEKARKGFEELSKKRGG